MYKCIPECRLGQEGTRKAGNYTIAPDLGTFLSYLRNGVHGHQPGDEALVSGDVGQHRRVAVADGHRPSHARVEVVVHANRQAGWFGSGPGEGDCLCGVAVPGVADTVRVAYGLDPALAELR